MESTQRSWRCRLARSRLLKIQQSLEKRVPPADCPPVFAQVALRHWRASRQWYPDPTGESYRRCAGVAAKRLENRLQRHHSRNNRRGPRRLGQFHRIGDDGHVQCHEMANQAIVIVPRMRRMVMIAVGQRCLVCLSLSSLVHVPIVVMVMPMVMTVMFRTRGRFGRGCRNRCMVVIAGDVVQCMPAHGQPDIGGDRDDRNTFAYVAKDHQWNPNGNNGQLTAARTVRL